MEYPKFSFRIAPEIATKLEKEATDRELTTSKLVREIVTTHYEKSAETGGTESIASEPDAELSWIRIAHRCGSFPGSAKRARPASPLRRGANAWCSISARVRRQDACRTSLWRRRPMH